MSVKVAATSAHTRPAQSVMAEGEIKEYIYNTFNDLGDGQVPMNPVVVLTNYRAPDEVIEEGAILDTPPIDGTRIYIRVANIEAKGVYLLTIEFDHTDPRVEDEHTVRYHVIEGV